MIKSNTLIETKIGKKRIDEITKDDLILSYDIRTGKTCYNKPLYLTKYYHKGNIINIGALTIAGMSGVIDYDLNYSELIDADLFHIPPKLFNLRTVNSKLVPNKQKTSFGYDEDYYYNLIVYNTDCFFANNILVSNNTTNIQVKLADTFYTVNKQLLNTNESRLDENINNLFIKYNIPEDVIMNTDLKYASSSFAFARQHISESSYINNIQVLDAMLKNSLHGERII